MLVSLRSNGRIEIELVPESAIERAFVDQMLQQAGKGKGVKLEQTEPQGMSIVMEK